MRGGNGRAPAETTSVSAGNVSAQAGEARGGQTSRSRNGTPHSTDPSEPADAEKNAIEALATCHDVELLLMIGQRCPMLERLKKFRPGYVTFLLDFFGAG